ncbi:MAG TPA: hypothetical protein VGY77_03830 [Gemmataceae bacterium]|nr:hypothetical protein [Gemmataceae bacterium]
MKDTKPRPFRKSLSLEELAEQQGVKPVDDLQEVTDLWPIDDDPDELLHFILKERRARRRLRREQE